MEIRRINLTGLVMVLMLGPCMLPAGAMSPGLKDGSNPLEKIVDEIKQAETPAEFGVLLGRMYIARFRNGRRWENEKAYYNFWIIQAQKKITPHVPSREDRADMYDAFYNYIFSEYDVGDKRPSDYSNNDFIWETYSWNPQNSDGSWRKMDKD